MNMLQQTMLAFTASSLLALSAHADVSGASSNTKYIQVGGTEYSTGTNPKDENNSGHTGQIGSPGIGVYTSKTPFKKVSLNRLEWLTRFGFGGKYDLSQNLVKIKAEKMPDIHKNFGNYNFSSEKTQNKLFSDKVYFGEWSKVDDMTDNTHTVYYVGKDKTNNMPTAGKVTYNVKGINNVENKGFLTGELKADFAKNSLSGDLSRNDLTIGVNATINSDTASFEGGATASGSSVAGTLAGKSKGEFFGENAYALGGTATFAGNPQYDTAFGGHK